MSEIPSSEPFEQVLDRVERLVLALVDQVITDEEFAELQRLLETSQEARARYLDVVQLQVDLESHFRDKRQENPEVEAKPAAPRLTFPESGLGDLSLQPPHQMGGIGD